VEYFVEDALVNEQARLGKLIEYALILGATHAKVIGSSQIPISEELAGLCENQRCTHYGTSINCPPHVSGPEGFRRLLRDEPHAIVFKLDVASQRLFTNESRDLFRLLHEVSALIELAAKDMGYGDSRAFASGGCKTLFCGEHPHCQALAENGSCPHSDRARPSMSGYGIDVARLVRNAGWEMKWLGPKADVGPESTSSLVGLVLVR